MVPHFGKNACFAFGYTQKTAKQATSLKIKNTKVKTSVFLAQKLKFLPLFFSKRGWVWAGRLLRNLLALAS